MAKTGNGRTFKGVTARTPNQKRFIQTINEKDFVLVEGVPGSGKSWVAVGMACEYWKAQKVDKIVFVRNSAHLTKEMGFSTGDWKSKNLILFDQVQEYFIRFLGEPQFRKMWDEGTIELTSTSIIRGRSWERCFIVLEEAQTCSKEDIILFLSRVDKESKVLLIGDRCQASPGSIFGSMIDKLEDEDVGVVILTDEDIQRHKSAWRICKKIRDI